MPDLVSASVRSRIMSSVKQRHTKPEMVVRSLLHRLGYRFRLHQKDLPGSPDIVLAKYRTAIFVHGCFWHQHENCGKSRRPSSNQEYWNKKLDENISRDKRKEDELSQLGWRVAIVWQCETTNIESLSENLKNLLS
jgi:DNA mismatch endonuclease (patch repair protein)